MNIDLDNEKKVQIDPLPVASQQVPEKRKPGRPRVRPEKVERHEATPGRLKALEKARAVKLAKRHEKEKLAKEQQNLTAPAQVNQGYHFAPVFDPDASMRQSEPSMQPNQGQPMAYYPSYMYTGNMGPDYTAQIERMTRVETLLNKFLETQPSGSEVPQNVATKPEVKLETHKSKLWNKNPWSR